MLDPRIISSEQSHLIDGETYLVSQVRICRKCKLELPLTLVNVELYIDKQNRIILWQHKTCGSQNTQVYGESPFGKMILNLDEKQEFLYGTP